MTWICYFLLLNKKICYLIDVNLLLKSVKTIFEIDSEKTRTPKNLPNYQFFLPFHVITIKSWVRLKILPNPLLSVSKLVSPTHKASLCFRLNYEFEVSRVGWMKKIFPPLEKHCSSRDFVRNLLLVHCLSGIATGIYFWRQKIVDTSRSWSWSWKLI